jgi:hypothetical protein
LSGGLDHIPTSEKKSVLVTYTVLVPGVQLQCCVDNHVSSTTASKSRPSVKNCRVNIKLSAFLIATEKFKVKKKNFCRCGPNE